MQIVLIAKERPVVETKDQKKIEYTTILCPSGHAYDRTRYDFCIKCSEKSP